VYTPYAGLPVPVPGPVYALMSQQAPLKFIYLPTSDAGFHPAPHPNVISISPAALG
jgi:hypothetical protein